MIINLTGHIASGKTTFATWWLMRHPTWVFFPIDKIREELAGKSEDKIWKEALHRLIAIPNDCIFESTGTIWRLKYFWHPVLRDRGIYTIRLVTTCKESQTLARVRNRSPLPGYDFDECRGIQLDDEYQCRLSANLIAPGGTQANEKTYELIEKYIMRAKIIFAAQQNKNSYIGNNNIPQGEN